MPLTVMVVDVQALLQNSKAAKMVRGQIEQKRNEYTKEISHQEETLRAERDALQRQQASMSADALNQKGREFQQKVNDLERNVQGKRQALEKSNGDALSKIQEQMLKIIADIAKDRKANLVFQRADLVLFDQSFDVTDEVLQKLDELMPTLTVDFAVPTPPPAAPTIIQAVSKSKRAAVVAALKLTSVVRVRSDRYRGHGRHHRHNHRVRRRVHHHNRHGHRPADRSWVWLR